MIERRSYASCPRGSLQLAAACTVSCTTALAAGDEQRYTAAAIDDAPAVALMAEITNDAQVPGFFARHDS